MRLGAARASWRAAAAADRSRPPRDHPVRRPAGSGQEVCAEAARGRVRPVPFRRSPHCATTAARLPKAIGWRVSGGSCRAPGNTAIFFRSWYRRVLDDRVLGRTDEDAARARVRRDQRVRSAAARLWDVDREAVLRRQRRRAGAAARANAAADPWLARGRRDEPIRVGDPAYQRRSTTCVPIPTRAGRRGGRSTATTSEQAAVAALTAIADAWAKAMPAEPPQLVVESRRLVRRG